MALNQITRDATVSMGLGLEFTALSEEKTKASKLSVPDYAVISYSDCGCWGVKPEQQIGQVMLYAWTLNIDQMPADKGNFRKADLWP